MLDTGTEAYATAIDHLYLAASQPDRWTEAMDAVRRLFDGSRACLLLVDPVTGYRSIPSLVDDEFDGSDAFELAVEDELHRAWLSLRPGEARVWREMMDLDAFRERDLARLHFSPRDMDNGLTLVLRASPTMRWSLDISRHRRQPDFSGAERSLVSRIAPHVLRALEIAAALHPAPGLPASAHAYAVVDARGRMLDLNEAARDLLARPGAPLCLSGAVLSGVVPADAARLAALIASCCASPDNARSAPGGMMIAAAAAHAPMQERLLLSVAPMAAAGWFALQPCRCALVLMRPLHVAPQAAIAALASAIYELSGSHARLAAALAAGLSMREAAAALGLGYGTARNYLEEIFRRTGTRRQAELVVLLKTIEATQSR